MQARFAGCAEGSRVCTGADGTSQTYYRCTNGVWTLFTCGSGYLCVSGSCQPMVPLCASGQQRCVGPREFLSCVGGQWTTGSCKPGDRCINIPGNMINCQVGGGRRARHNVRESALMIVPPNAIV
ncbi:hypothetical protein EC988_008456 [Linderina pennispora]|nr:hypothetical protein EC988_008456 [Linderina pennispora]